MISLFSSKVLSMTGKCFILGGGISKKVAGTSFAIYRSFSKSPVHCYPVITQKNAESSTFKPFNEVITDLDEDADHHDHHDHEHDHSHHNEKQLEAEDFSDRNDDTLVPDEYVNPVTGERGGPRGPEPTRYGDWSKNGRVSDF